MHSCKICKIVNYEILYNLYSCELINKNINPGDPGIALYVETNGNIVYNKGFGLADESGNKTIDSKTNFRLASVSKQFVSKI